MWLKSENFLSYLSQIGSITKIYPQGAETQFLMFDSRFSFYPAGCVSRYNKQRALEYEPRAVSPDALFACLEKLSELADKASSPELDKEICTVLKQITAEFLFPGKG